jgi:hypothetical protein
MRKWKSSAMPLENPSSAILKLPRGLRLPTDRRGVRQLEITDCDFKVVAAFVAPYALTEPGVTMLSSVQPMISGES